MKIALCLHGLFDSLTDPNSKGSDGYHHIKERILNNRDVDIYIHSWEPHKKDEICNLYSPKDSIFEPQKDFNPLIREREFHLLQGCPRPPFSVLSHIYSVEQSINLAYASGIKYDLVIKTRFDTGRINRINEHRDVPAVQCINLVDDIVPNSVYMANWNSFYMGPPDIWFYGDYGIMKNFCTLYQDLLGFMHINSEYHDFAKSIEGNSGDISNASVIYKYWMIKKGIWEKSTKINTTWN